MCQGIPQSIELYVMEGVQRTSIIIYHHSPVSMWRLFFRYRGHYKTLEIRRHLGIEMAPFTLYSYYTGILVSCKYKNKNNIIMFPCTLLLSCFLNTFIHELSWIIIQNIVHIVLCVSLYKLKIWFLLTDIFVQKLLWVQNQISKHLTDNWF